MKEYIISEEDRLKKENKELIKEISKFRNDHKIMVKTLADRIDGLKKQLKDIKYLSAKEVEKIVSEHTTELADPQESFISEFAIPELTKAILSLAISGEVIAEKEVDEKERLETTKRMTIESEEERKKRIEEL